MTSATLELQKAVFDTLTANETLVGLLGEARIYDHAPANVAFPYITFGRTTGFDWSTSTEDGSEHIFTVHVWSKERGKSETLAIIEAARAALSAGSLSLEWHSLVNLQREFEEVRYDEDLQLYHGLLRFRAVTEPAG